MSNPIATSYPAKGIDLTTQSVPGSYGVPAARVDANGQLLRNAQGHQYIQDEFLKPLREAVPTDGDFVDIHNRAYQNRTADPISKTQAFALEHARNGTKPNMLPGQYLVAVDGKFQSFRLNDIGQVINQSGQVVPEEQLPGILQGNQSLQNKWSQVLGGQGTPPAIGAPAVTTPAVINASQVADYGTKINNVSYGWDKASNQAVKQVNGQWITATADDISLIQAHQGGKNNLVRLMNQHAASSGASSVTAAAPQVVGHELRTVKLPDGSYKNIMHDVLSDGTAVAANGTRTPGAAASGTTVAAAGTPPAANGTSPTAPAAAATTNGGRLQGAREWMQSHVSDPYNEFIKNRTHDIRHGVHYPVQEMARNRLMGPKIHQTNQVAANGITYNRTQLGQELIEQANAAAQNINRDTMRQIGVKAHEAAVNNASTIREAGQNAYNAAMRGKDALAGDALAQAQQQATRAQMAAQNKELQKHVGQAIKQNVQGLKGAEAGAAQAVANKSAAAGLNGAGQLSDDAIHSAVQMGARRGVFNSSAKVAGASQAAKFGSFMSKLPARVPVLAVATETVFDFFDKDGVTHNLGRGDVGRAGRQLVKKGGAVATSLATAGAGAKAGAIVGSFFGPIGTGVGAVVGGIIGGGIGYIAASGVLDAILPGRKTGQPSQQDQLNNQQLQLRQQQLELTGRINSLYAS
ncbi:MAG: hypothetical protein SFZ03_02070 [Candidatus Melainabacteria bacterium]|nr:hypothetical protein [Candidatus Melainabacteria bacterium]